MGIIMVDATNLESRMFLQVGFVFLGGRAIPLTSPSLSPYLYRLATNQFLLAKC